MLVSRGLIQVLLWSAASWAEAEVGSGTGLFKTALASLDPGVALRRTQPANLAGNGTAERSAATRGNETGQQEALQRHSQAAAEQESRLREKLREALARAGEAERQDSVHQRQAADLHEEVARLKLQLAKVVQEEQLAQQVQQQALVSQRNASARISKLQSALEQSRAIADGARRNQTAAESRLHQAQEQEAALSHRAADLRSTLQKEMAKDRSDEHELQQQLHRSQVRLNQTKSREAEEQSREAALAQQRRAADANAREADARAAAASAQAQQASASRASAIADVTRWRQRTQELQAQLNNLNKTLQKLDVKESQRQAHQNDLTNSQLGQKLEELQSKLQATKRKHEEEVKTWTKQRRDLQSELQRQHTAASLAVREQRRVAAEAIAKQRAIEEEAVDAAKKREVESQAAEEREAKEAERHEKAEQNAKHTAQALRRQLNGGRQQVLVSVAALVALLLAGMVLLVALRWHCLAERTEHIEAILKLHDDREKVLTALEQACDSLQAPLLSNGSKD